MKIQCLKLFIMSLWQKQKNKFLEDFREISLVGSFKIEMVQNFNSRFISFWGINFNMQILSTAVEQALACAPVSHRPGFDPRSRHVSWVRFSSGFFRISFGRHNHPFIFTLLEWTGAWMVCIALHFRVVSEVAPALGSCLIRGGPPCPCVVLTGLGSVRTGRRESRKCIYKVKIKLRWWINE